MPPDPILNQPPTPNPVVPRPPADPVRTLVNFAQKVANYLWDVVAAAIVLSKIPLTIYLLLSLSLILLRNVVDTASWSLGPICTVFPVVPICHRVHVLPPGSVASPSPVYRVGGVDFPSLMELQSRTLHHLLSQSAAGYQLALGIKQAELAVQDLGTLVKVNNLTTKDALARALEDFTVDAKATGRGLQRLSAKLYGAVDNILAFDDYALRKIAVAQASRGPSVRKAVLQTFHSSMNLLSSEVSRVILETTAVVSRLDALEERLGTIHVLCEQENVLTAAAQESVFSELWTYLGGNRAKIFQLTQQMVTLQNVVRYRSLAAAHVAATLEALETIEAELTQLREKLTAPGFIDEIPIEAHIASIDRSARRLKDSKGQINERRDNAYEFAGALGSDARGAAQEESHML